MKTKHSLVAVISAVTLSTVVIGMNTLRAEAKHNGEAEARIIRKLNLKDSSGSTAAASDQGSSAAGSEESSSGDSESSENTSNTGSSSPGISLFTVLENLGGGWLAILAGLGFLAAAHVMVPAMVWHLGKVARGGNRPRVG